jgi:hypothetical protein
MASLIDYSNIPDTQIVCADGKTLGFYSSVINRYPGSTLYAALNGGFRESIDCAITLNWKSKYVNKLLNDMYKNAIYANYWNNIKEKYKYIVLIDEVGCFQNSDSLNELISEIFDTVPYHFTVDLSNDSYYSNKYYIAAKYALRLYNNLRHLVPDKHLCKIPAAILNTNLAAEQVPKDIFKDLCNIYGVFAKFNVNIITYLVELIKYMDKCGISNKETFKQFCELIYYKCDDGSFRMDSIIKLMIYVRDNYPDELYNVVTLLENTKLRISLTFRDMVPGRSCDNCRRLRKEYNVKKIKSKLSSDNIATDTADASDIECDINDPLPYHECKLHTFVMQLLD